MHHTFMIWCEYILLCARIKQTEIGYSFDLERKAVSDSQKLQETERGYAVRAQQYLHYGDEYAEFAKILKRGST